MQKFILLIILSIFTLSCDKEEVDPPLGSIAGLVVDESSGNTEPSLVKIMQLKEAIDSVLTETRGRFKFVDIPTGNYNVLVENSLGYKKQQTVNVKDGILSTLTINLSLATDCVKGMIVNEDNEGVPNAKIVLLANGKQVAEAFTDQYGYFKIENVQAGEYQLQINCSCFQELSQGFTKTDKPSNFVLPLEYKLRNIVGIVTDRFGKTLQDARLKLMWNEELIGQQVSNKIGNFYFDKIKERAYQMEVTRAGYKSKTLDMETPYAKDTLQIVLTPLSNPSAGYIGYKNSEGEISLDLFVVDADGKFIPGLSKNNFNLAAADVNGTSTSYTISKVEQMDTPFVGATSSGILLDQSGSIISEDPNDLRIHGTKAFLSALGSADEYLLGSFPDFTAHSTEFLKDPQEVYPILDQLANSEQGGTPLYESSGSMLTLIDQKANNSNKNMIVFTDGQGNDINLIDGVIEKAKNTNIRIFTIGLGAGVNNNNLGKLAFETGGIYLKAEKAEKLVSIFSSLYGYVTGGKPFYRTTWKVVANGDVSNKKVQSNVKIDVSGEAVDVPVGFTLK